jgi:uncharacterized OB-fold protein
MVKMQTYVKKWYDFLAKDKIMGLKCNRCGSYEFPPVPVCNNCSGTDLSWVEMSGEGQLVSFGLAPHSEPPLTEFAPYISGTVALKEGPTYNAMVVGVDPKRAAELYGKLPIPVRVETQDRGDFKFVAFRLKA